MTFKRGSNGTEIQGSSNQIPELPTTPLTSSTNLQQPHLFGDTFHDHSFNSQSMMQPHNLNGYDGGDGGSITVLTNIRNIHLLNFVQIDCKGGEGGVGASSWKQPTESGTTSTFQKSIMKKPFKPAVLRTPPILGPPSPNPSSLSEDMLTFSQLSYFAPATSTLNNLAKLKSKKKEVSLQVNHISDSLGGSGSFASSSIVFKGLDGRKGRDGNVKYIIVDDSGEIIEQTNERFLLEVVNFEIVPNSPKLKQIATPMVTTNKEGPASSTQVERLLEELRRKSEVLIIEEDEIEKPTKEEPIETLPPKDTTIPFSSISGVNLESIMRSAEHSTIETLEPGSEFFIVNIQVRNIGGMTSPDGYSIAFKGNNLFDAYGFLSKQSSTSSSQQDDSKLFHDIPSLACGETFTVPVPFLARVKQSQSMIASSEYEAQVKESIDQEEFISFSSNRPMPSIIPKDEKCSFHGIVLCNKVEIYQTPPRVLSVRYPVAIDRLDVPRVMGIHNDPQIVQIQIRNRQPIDIHHVMIRVRAFHQISPTTFKELNLTSNNLQLFSLTRFKNDTSIISKQLMSEVSENNSSVISATRTEHTDLKTIADQETTRALYEENFSTIEGHAYEFVELNLALEKLSKGQLQEQNATHMRKRPDIEDLLSFCSARIVIELFYKGVRIEKQVRSLVLIPNSILLNNFKRKSHWRKDKSKSVQDTNDVLMITDSERLSHDAYLFYKKLLLALNLRLQVWDVQYLGRLEDDAPEYGKMAELFSNFRDKPVIVTAFHSSDIHNLGIEKLLSHFYHSASDDGINICNDSGLLIVTGNPKPIGKEVRDQLFFDCTQNVELVDSKSLSIIYPFEKPSKKLFQEKIQTLLRKKEYLNPSRLFQVLQSEYHEPTKSRLPRKIILGAASLNTLPLRSNDRMFRYVEYISIINI